MTPIRRTIIRKKRLRSDRKALEKRQYRVSQCGNTPPPVTLNQPVFHVDKDGHRSRVLVRHRHRRTGNYCFSLDYRLQAQDRAFLLVCLDKEQGLGHVIWVDARNCPNYLTFSPEQAQRLAFEIIRY